jgi:hypothetical protein
MSAMVGFSASQNPPVAGVRQASPAGPCQAVARWSVGAKVKTIGGVFQARDAFELSLRYPNQTEPKK